MEIWRSILLMISSCCLLAQVKADSEGSQDSVDYRRELTQLATQVMSQQMFIEERIRSDGVSGLKQVRSTRYGTDTYFESTHIGNAVAAMHDHCEGKDGMGMGETIVVMNGVEFRTRHNDYQIRRASTTDKTYNAVESITSPNVPPEVLAKPTVDEQAREMKEWIRAFAEQDYSVRDYRKYFRPLLCYMEGMWTLDESIIEPFESDRHTLVASSWDQLRQQIQYTSYSGGKHSSENFAYLPRTIMSINETTGKPLYAQWNYNILCHPYSGDIPTKYLRQQDDWAYRQAGGRTLKGVGTRLRGARYRLSEYDTPQAVGYSLIDKIMAEIPGKDNIPPPLNEEPLGYDIYDVAFAGKMKKLNTGYYHRMYKISVGDAKGITSAKRGYSDDLLFFAETTQKRIAPMKFKKCAKRNQCTTKSTRFTWAIPLEIVYTTPLQTWNPYNFTQWDVSIRKTPSANGRTGQLTVKKAFNGTCIRGYHFLTPARLFDDFDAVEDPADSVKRRKTGVLDQQGVVRETVPSGNCITLKHMPGVGFVRIRYPIVPLHVEGSNIFKELAVVKMKLDEIVTSLKLESATDKDGFFSKPNVFRVQLDDSSFDGPLHTHGFELTQSDYDKLMKSEILSFTTSQQAGHTHDVSVTWNGREQRLYCTKCDGERACWDGHPQMLILEKI